MTAYRKKKNGDKQISTSRRIYLGGNSVDNEYRTLLGQIFTEAVIRKTKLDFLSDYNDILSKFERTKRYERVSVNCTRKITIRIPPSLITTYETMMNTGIQDAIHKSKYNGSVTIVADKIRIIADMYRQLYQKLCEEIISEIRKTLQDNELTSISAFFLVGGLAESEIVQQFIKEAFPEMQILVSNESANAVMHGAVQLWLKYNPNPVVHAVSTRIFRHTYGIRVQPLFDESIHDPTKRFYLDGVLRCMDVFDIFIRSGESLSEKKVSREVNTIRKMQKKVEITIVSSTLQNPQYVDGPDCFILGKLSLFVDDAPKGRAIKVSIDFSGTEIAVEAKDKETDKMVEGFFNFLG